MTECTVIHLRPRPSVWFPTFASQFCNIPVICLVEFVFLRTVYSLETYLGMSLGQRVHAGSLLSTKLWPKS